jgi:glycosyltransferase involved in cell wall biosynthesis
LLQDNGECMRVIYLNPSGQLGGAENSLLDILACLKTARPDWELVLIAAEPGPLISRATDLGVLCEVIPFPAKLAEMGDTPIGGNGCRQTGVTALLAAGPEIIRYTKQLQTACLRFSPDLMHSNGLKMHVLSAWARPAYVPIVWHVHDFIGRRPLMSRLLRLHLAKCSGVLANSRAVAADFQVACGNATRLKTVYNAVDLERFAPFGSRLDLDALSQLPAAALGTIRIGLLATMAWWKGHRVFLEAVAQLPRNLPIRAYVIGGALYQTNGSQRTVQELKDLAAELGILPKVGFTGFVEDTPAALRSLDIVVHASTQPEPFGRVLVEAMACSRPVLTSHTGGAGEVVTIGEDALEHTAGDPSSLAAAIAQLATDSALRVGLGRAGRKTAEARFNRNRLAGEVTSFYREIASRRVN